MTVLFDLFPFSFSIRAISIAGASLWSLALYLNLNRTVVSWVQKALLRWFNFAERSLYLDPKEFEDTRPVRESVNAFYASVMSIVPFLVLGCGGYALAGNSLGSRWAVLVGMMGCVIGFLQEVSHDTGHSV